MMESLQNRRGQRNRRWTDKETADVKTVVSQGV